MWPRDPDLFYDFQQARHLGRREGGVCYGMCRNILELDSAAARGNDAAASFARIRQRAGSAKFVDRARKAQGRRRQTGRRQASVPLDTNRFYIVGCNLSETSGWIFRYSLASYIPMRSTWRADHAVIVFGIGDSTIMFDPNWGVACWHNMAIGGLSWRNIENLIAGGYRRIGPVYVAECET